MKKARVCRDTPPLFFFTIYYEVKEMKKKLAVISIIAALGVGGLFYFGFVQGADASLGKVHLKEKPKTVKKTKPDTKAATNESTKEITEEPEKKPAEKEPEIYSQQILLENLNTGQILEEKNADKRVPIASLTKIMSAFVLLDKAPNIEDTVVLSQKTIDDLTLEGASRSGFVANDPIKVKDLAYAIILPSGADAAILTANYLSGSEAAFVAEMNNYAQYLGLHNTHFENSTGLDSANQYSTARDLNKLVKVAMQNPVFADVFTRFEYKTSPTKLEKDGYHLEHTLLNEKNDLSLNNGQLLGGKTGYTEDAGQCLASIAEINGERYLLITTGADGDPNGTQHNVTDAKKIYESIGVK